MIFRFLVFLYGLGILLSWNCFDKSQIICQENYLGSHEAPGFGEHPKKSKNRTTCRGFSMNQLTDVMYVCLKKLILLSTLCWYTNNESLKISKVSENFVKVIEMWSDMQHFSSQALCLGFLAKFPLWIF